MTKKLMYVLLFYLIGFCVGCHIPGTAASDKDSDTLEIIFGGDIDFGDRYHQHTEKKVTPCVLKEKGYGHSFGKIKPLLQSTQYLIANLETPLYRNIENNPLKGKKRYLHWCQPTEAIKVLKEMNFSYLNLANNHVLDQSNKGLEATISHLESANIVHFGAGVNSLKASQPVCLGKTLGKRKVFIIAGFEYRLSYDQNYQFYASESLPGVNKWDEKDALKQIKTLRKQNPEAFIIAFPHWGDNYKWANKKQELLGQTLIDAGVNLIVGHGAHKFQEIGQYKDSKIFYSLGNLVMNSPGRYDKMNALAYSFILKLSLREKGSNILPEFKVYPVFSNNKVTNYQPHFVTKKEMQLIQNILIEKSEIPEITLSIHKDEYGYYFTL